MAVLLETLLPPGDLGDGQDSTLVERSATFAGALSVPQLALALNDLTVVPASIDFLRFFARVGWFWNGPGPVDPQVWVRWRLGAAGTIVNADAVFVPGGVGVYSQVDGLLAADPDMVTDPTGAPWTVANVNNLRMAGAFFVDDSGSGELTTCQVTRLWAEVWGTLPPTAVPKLRGSGVVNKIRGSGEVGSKLAGAGVVNRMRGGGILSSKRTAAGVVNKVRATGVVRVTED